MTTTPERLADIERLRHADAVRRASVQSRAADHVALQAREDFYRTLAEAHGNPADGKLTYDEISEVSGWTRGWVRLAISNYKKRKADTTT